MNMSILYHSGPAAPQGGRQMSNCTGTYAFFSYGSVRLSSPPRPRKDVPGVVSLLRSAESLSLEYYYSRARVVARIGAECSSLCLATF
jgi:hypothetical protein